MGGYGSGNWLSRGKAKTTAERCFVLGIGEFRDRLFDLASGTITWTQADDSTSSVGFFVTTGDRGPVLTLHYRLNGEADVNIPIRLQSTPTQFKGRRWWFSCPLIVDGVPCERRVGKVYLPPGGRYFGCRHCHDLTYRSSQEAHQAERLKTSLQRLVKRWLPDLNPNMSQP